MLKENSIKTTKWKYKANEIKKIENKKKQSSWNKKNL